MKFAVTGANGYIGRYIVRELLDKGCSVTAVDVSVDDVDERADKVVMSVFDDDKDVYEKLNRPDVCIHMAWRNGFVHNNISHIEDLPKHVNFLKNMIEGGLKQVVVMGSMHEVGYWEGAIDENTPANPQSFYGIAKNALRQALYTMTSDKDVCVQWVRGYYILGDDLHNQSIFTKILKADKEGQKLFPFTSGKNKYDFISVQELACQIALVAMQNKVDGIINCCTGKPVSLAEQVEKFISDNNLDIKLEYGAFKDRPYDSPMVWGNRDKFDKVLEIYK